MNETPGDHPGVVIFPPLLFVICLACGTAAHLLCPYRIPDGRWTWSAGIVAIASGLIALWAKRVMKAAGTNVRPDLPALAIVDSGPFAFTRNPLYTSLMLLYTAIGLALRSPAFLVVLVPLAGVLHFGVVLREERYLDAKFGDAYRAYRARVRRWI